MRPTRELWPLVLVATLDGGAASAAAAVGAEPAAGAVLQLRPLLQDQDPMAGELIRGAGAGLPAPLQGHRICGEELSGGACSML